MRRIGSIVCVPAAFEKPGVVDLYDAPMQPSGKKERMAQAGDDFRNGFSSDFRLLLACFGWSPGNRSFSKRISSVVLALRLTHFASKRIKSFCGAKPPRKLRWTDAAVGGQWSAMEISPRTRVGAGSDARVAEAT